MKTKTNDKVLTSEQRELVKNHMGIVYKLANQYTKTNRSKLIKKRISNDDLVQEGFVEMCKSARTFDEDKAKFSTHAYKWVNWGLLKFIDEFNIVKIPERRLWSNDTNKGYLREITSIEQSGIGSLNLPTSNDGDEGETIDFIKDDTDNYEQSNLFTQLEDNLEVDEVQLIKLLCEEKTQTQIGEIMGKSQMTANIRIVALREKIKSLSEDGVLDLEIC